jgi:aquaporin Z
VKAVAPALVIAALVFTIGSVSGAHVNPAVTLGFALRRAFPWQLVPAYWAAQLVGCVAAGLAARGLLGGPAREGVPTPAVPTAQAWWWEIALTVLLVLVVLGTGHKAQLLGPEAGIPVASVLAMDGLVGVPFSGASMNPARALGPAAAFGDLPDLLYLLAPLAGAAVAVVLAWCVFGPTRQEEQHAALGEGD